MKHWGSKGHTFYDFQATLTSEQKEYLDSMEKMRMTISNSVSGSGKTTLAVALSHLHGKKLLYIFFPVEEDKMGFRPGTQQKKESAYHGPVIDALIRIGEDPMKSIKWEEVEEQETQWKSMASSKKSSPQSSTEPWVEVKSHIFLRGTNIGEDGDLTVILDETQNGTRAEIKKVLSRIHDAATVVVIGHTGQIDLADPKMSGFPRCIEHFSPKHYAKVVNLTHNFRGELSKDADEM